MSKNSFTGELKTPVIKALINRGSLDHNPPKIDPPTEEIVVNKGGGKGTKLKVAYHLIPTSVMKALSKVYCYGAYLRPLPDGGSGYGAWNWRKVESWDHYNHLLEHLQNWRAELAKPYELRDLDYIKDELEHALCRMSMLFSKEHNVEEWLADYDPAKD